MSSYMEMAVVLTARTGGAQRCGRGRRTLTKVACEGVVFVEAGVTAYLLRESSHA